MNVLRELSPDFVEFMLGTYQVVNRYCETVLRPAILTNYTLPKEFLSETRIPNRGIIQLTNTETKPIAKLITTSGFPLIDESVISAVTRGYRLSPHIST